MTAVEKQTEKKGQLKRLGIYFFYDKDGIVDEYNLVLLRDLKENLEKLLVVCNGALTPEGKARFASVADEVLVRENRGFDVWAYKEGMEHYGWSELSQYDERVSANADRKINVLKRIVRKAYFETSMILYDTISYFIIHPLIPTLDCSFGQNRGHFWNQHEISILDDASHSMRSFE